MFTVDIGIFRLSKLESHLENQNHELDLFLCRKTSEGISIKLYLWQW